MFAGYLAGLCVVTAVVLLGSDFSIPEPAPRFWNTIGVLVSVGLVAEATAITLPGTSLTTSVVYIPFLAGVLLVGPAWTMLVAGVTEVAAESLIRQKPVQKVVFNAAKTMLAVGAAALVFGLGKGEVSIQGLNPSVVPAFFGASLTFFLVSNGATAAAVWLATDTQIDEVWGQLVSKDLIWNVLSSSISILLVYLYIELQLIGLLLLLVPLFLVRQTLQQNMELEQANRDLLELMVKSIEARDPYTSGHSVRVAMYARALAKVVGCGPREVEQIETAALLHDVGKIYEEFGPILRKEGKLDREERMLMETHPLRSAEMVGTISSLRGYVQLCVRAHHEAYDGNGYPDGVRAEDIPIGARIIAVADTADAMMTDRPYRRALTYEEVLLEFERCAGTQFDPKVVAAFKRSPAVQRLVADRPLITPRRLSGSLVKSAATA